MRKQNTYFIPAVLAAVFIAGNVLASGLVSTKYNVFVPPNDDHNSRHASLIITAIQDSTFVDAEDDSADGDSDDSWSGYLMRGESYFIKIREGAVDDDTDGKQDGDFFKVRTTKPVYVLNLTVETTWQHDFIPSDNKMVGVNFYVYAPDFNNDNPALCLFSYYGNTDVRIIDITGAAKTTTGLVTVLPDSQGTENKMLFAVAGQSSGILRLTPGHTYHIISSKDIAAQYGALYYEDGPWGTATNARDGGAYVPARNGSKSGQTFYFMIPATHITREMRLISYRGNAHIQVHGTIDSGSTYDLITAFDLNQYDHKDLISSDLDAGGNNYHFFRVTSNKNIAVFEGTSMETGNYGTSDMGTSVSSEDGNSQGRRFTTYMAPPGNEPVGGVNSATRASHLYVYANDTTVVEAYDIDSYGEYIELHNTTDSTVRLDGWELSSNSGECIFGAADTIPARGYFLMEYDERATDAPADLVYGTLFPNLRMANNDDRLVLKNASGTRIDRCYYKNTWENHGNHLALEKLDPTLSAYSNAANWADADSSVFTAYTSGTNLGDYYGTPGAENSGYDSSGAGSVPVAINEIMTGRFFQLDTVDYETYADIHLDTAIWEAINNGDNPDGADSTEPEAPYITVETDRLVSLLNMNWNDNWLAYVGAVISPTPEMEYEADYYQRLPGKPVTFTLTAWNTMFDSLDNVVTRIDIPLLMDYAPGSYTTPPEIGGVTPVEVQNPDSTWTVTWDHGGKGMRNDEVYVFTVTASVDSGISDSTFMVSNASLKGVFDGDVYSRQDFANILVGVEKSISDLVYTNAAGETTFTFAGGDTVFVRVEDDDENKDAFAVDTISFTAYNSANGDSETVRLPETGLNTAAFTGAVVTVTSGAAVTGNGVVLVASGHTVYGEYIDADDASDISLAPAYIVPVSQLKIVDGGGAEVGALTLTTDNDTSVFYAVGYDSLGNEYPGLTVAWFFDSLGTAAPDTADSTVLNLSIPGTGYLWAVHPDGAADSTGLLTVNPGRAVDVTITPDSGSGTTDDTLTFGVTGQDADGNATADVGTVIWSGGEGVGSYIDTAGVSVRFSLDLPGTDSLAAVSSYGVSDTSGPVRAVTGAEAALIMVPDSAFVTTDTLLRLTALAADADGNTWNVTDSASTVWSTDDFTASVDSGRYAPGMTGNFIVYAAGSGCADTCYVQVTHGRPAGLTVTPDSATITADGTLQLSARARDAAGITWDVTGTALWDTDDPAAAVDSGRYGPDSAGIFHVDAFYNGFTDTVTVTVLHGTAVTLRLTPSADTLSADSTGQFTAVAVDAGGNTWDVTDSAATVWSTTDGGASAAGGLYAPVAAGYNTVRAEYEGAEDSALVLVRHGSIGSLAVVPPLAVVVRYSLLEFSALAFDGDGNTWVPGSGVVWTTDDSTGAVDTAGRYTAGTDLGGFTVTAHYQALAGTALVSVIDDTVIDHIRIEYDNGVPVGDTALSADNDTTRLYARYYNGDDSLMGEIGVDWGIIGTPAGSVRPDQNSRTLLTLDGTGMFRVTAGYNGTVSDTSGMITVFAGQVVRIELDPLPAGVRPGDTLQPVVTGYDADDNAVPDSAVGPYLVWSGAGSIGTWEDISGTEAALAITGIGRDSFTVTDTLHALADTAMLVSTTTRIAYLRLLNGLTDTMTVFDALACSAYAYDSTDNRVEGIEPQWWLSGLLGLFSPVQGSLSTLTCGVVGSGSLHVHYYDPFFDTTHTAVVPIEVTHGPVHTVMITGAGGAAVGDTVLSTDDDGFRCFAFGFDSLGNPAGPVTVDWRVDMVGNVLPVRDTGTVLECTTPGSGRIHARYGSGIADSTGVFTVAAGTLARVEIVPDSIGISAVDSAYLSLDGYDADGNPLTGFGDFVWRTAGAVTGTFSADTAAAGDSTVYRPLSTGTGVIIVTGTGNGVSDTVPLTVAAGRLDSLVIIRGDGTEAGSLTVTTDNDTSLFIARGFDAAGNGLGPVYVQWSLTGADSIGRAQPDSADSIMLVITGTGEGRLVASYGAVTDTAGPVIVTGGRADRLTILPDTAVLTADDSLVLRVRALDADGNVTADIGTLTWQALPGLGGSFITAADSAVYLPVPSGIGLISAVSGYGAADTTGPVTVLPGRPVTVATEPAGPETLLIYERLKLKTYGYDRNGNATGILTADWDTAGSLTGDFGSMTDAESLVFTAGAGGEGMIISLLTDGSDTLSRDTVRVKVLPYWVASVAVVDAGTTAVDADTLTIDDGSLTVFAAGYDTLGAFLKLVEADWQLTGTGAGTLAILRGTGSRLDVERPGTVMISIDFRNGAAADSTGTITVLPGRARSISIVPDGDTLLVDDSISFTVSALDMKGNSTTDIGALTWSGGTAVGHFAGAAGDTGIFITDTLGVDSVRVVSGYGPADTSGPVLVVPRAAAFGVKAAEGPHYLKAAVSCTILVLDRFGQVIPGYPGNVSPITIRPLVMSGPAWGASDGNIVYGGSGVTGNDSTGLIGAGAGFVDGRLVFTINYDVPGESLFIRVTDTADTLITGISGGIIWEDPNLLSRLRMYPSPVNFNTVGSMTVGYVLKYDSKVTVRILSATGAFVWQKVYEKGDPGGQKWGNSVAWNGKSRRGNYVGSGAYVIKVVAESDKGSAMQKRKVGVIGKRR